MTILSTSRNLLLAIAMATALTAGAAQARESLSALRSDVDQNSDGVAANAAELEELRDALCQLARDTGAPKPPMCQFAGADWLVGTACNGTDFGGGCTPAETGYHYVGEYDGYQCWWHTKNQAWNTTTATNLYNLAQTFGLNPSSGRQGWCHPRAATPTPSAYSGNYNSPSNVGAWGWCGGAPFASGGFACFLEN